MHYSLFSALMFNSDITVEEFLADYWQKKPRLFRNAFPGFRSPLSAEELAGLACEENSNARLIIESEQKPYWSVEYGPLAEDRYSTLPETNWTLLVSDVEKFVVEGRDLLEHFRFIPDWRIDDLMISYAVKGGSVGPHTDAYDVFLIQAEGQRHWGINDSVDKDDLLEDIELRILSSFDAEQDWILEPGDMLYLPPNVAHHGVAMNDCITCSVGFRSPSVHTLISEYAESVAACLPQELRYTDPDLQRQEKPAEITQPAIDKIRQLLVENLKIDDSFIRRWIGEHLTESNEASPYELTRQENIPADIGSLRSVSTLATSLTSKLLYTKDGDGALIFVDGKSYETSTELAETLCNSRINACTDVLRSIQNKRDEDTLLALIDAHHLLCDG